MSRIAFPFLVLSTDVVNFSGWMIGSPDEPLSPAKDILEHWDYEQDIQIQVHLEIDFAKAADELGVDATHLKLSAVLIVGTGSGSLPRRLERLSTESIDINCSTVTLGAIIQGGMLSGQLVLNVRLVLESPTKTTNPLSPDQRGALLWQIQKNILLEDGGDSRFPIELASFSEIFKGQSEQYSPWLVEWKPTNLDADFCGNVRLYINSENESIAKRFVDGDQVTLQTILADVMTQMIEVVLDTNDEDELDKYEEGSIGYQARMWIDMSFVGKTLDDIRQMRKLKPGKFRASILTAADFGGE